MKLLKLNEYIPYVKGGKRHSLSANIYPGVDIAMPGRHAEESNGGDAVVLISDEGTDWVKHQFTHSDIFQDIQQKTDASSRPGLIDTYAKDYLRVLLGTDPATFANSPDYERILPGIHPLTLQYAVQVLAVIEHRRYAKHEAKFGGRFLPFRFASGIVEGLWSAAEATDKQKWGRPAVERLERERGVPILTKELFNA